MPPTLPPSPPAGAITVSRLTAMIRAAVQTHLPGSLLVAGELSNVSRPSSGHLYFTLKDAASEVRCAMWRSAATHLRFDPADGLAVLATGTVDVYEPRGQVQLYVTRLEPRGVGALELAFRQLREKLEARGWFDARRKRPLPLFPRRIAVVTSLTGAAGRDIAQTIRRRFPCVTLLFHPVRVQGDGAAAEIAGAIAAINRSAAALGGVDVMIVGRGGGSLEDLWAFNEEAVAQAIFDSRIPIVSAVGHEIDVSISDLVADVRAATPTAAAELVVPLRAELLDHLDRQSARSLRALRHRLATLASRLDRLAATELLRDPLGYARRREQRVDDAATRLRAALTQALSAARARLHRAEVGLHRVRPEAVLARRRQRLEAVTHRLHWAQGHANVLAERRVSAAWAALMRASPLRVAQRYAAILGQLRVRLSHAAAESVARRRAALDSLAARRAAASHEKVLARGFSLTRIKRSRQIVRDPAQVREGDRITTQTAAGDFDSKVVDAHQAELFE